MEDNVFEAKTVDEAILEGITALHITLDEAEIEVIEEGKKKLFGSVKAKVRITKKGNFLQRATTFLDGLFDKMGVKANCKIKEDAEEATIIIESGESSKLIGKHGEVLEALQNLAGAVANIGNEEYKKVVVDCEEYRDKREETLKKLALKVAKSAVEKGKKVSLEPMTPYERRLIHSALSDYEGVKTVSEGKEPMRFVSVVPDGCDPNDKGIKFGSRGRDDRHHRHHSKDRGGKPHGGRHGDRPRSSGGSKPRAKKEIHFGTFLGNSNSNNEE